MRAEDIPPKSEWYLQRERERERERGREEEEEEIMEGGSAERRNLESLLRLELDRKAVEREKKRV